MTFDNETSQALAAMPVNADRLGLTGALLQRMLRTCTHGSIAIRLPLGQTVTHCGTQPGPSVDVTFHRWRGLWNGVLAGHLGLAQSYVDGDWTTPDLKALFDFCLANEAALGLVSDRYSPTKWLSQILHWLRRNSKQQSRRNISAHYDLGNEFYAAWLDASMNYSSALYADEGESLCKAQDNKLHRIVDLLELNGGERVLEIGFGWGALAERLAAKTCHVTGLTLSKEQLAFARRRLDDKQLSTCADLQLKDYRDIDGQFDRIVSIEMLEAVGEAYWPQFFRKIRESLRKDGVALLQVITIEAARFADYRERPDFIQHYIFPGGMLPTIEAMIAEARKAGLALTLQQNFGESYARTLAAWRARFEGAWPHIGSIGFDARFKRMWDFYLIYCQAGFERRAIDVGFYQFKPL